MPYPEMTAAEMKAALKAGLASPKELAKLGRKYKEHEDFDALQNSSGDEREAKKILRLQALYGDRDNSLSAVHGTKRKPVDLAISAAGDLTESELAKLKLPKEEYPYSRYYAARTKTYEREKADYGRPSDVNKDIPLKMKFNYKTKKWENP